MKTTEFLDFAALGEMKIVGYVPCGQPLEMFDDVSGEKLYEYLSINPKQTFLFVARGNSMTGANLHNGDVVIVDTAKEPRAGSIVLAVINGELTIKTLVLETTRTDGSLTYQRVKALLPENSAYEAIYPAEFDDVCILGVVRGKVDMWE